MNKQVILFSSEFPPLPGGIGNHAYNLAKNLSSIGMQVQVLTDFRSQEIATERAFDQSLPFRVIRVTRRRPILFTYLRRMNTACRLLRTKTPQLVLASGKFSLWIAALGSKVFPQHRYLAVIHGSEINPVSILPKYLTHWSLRQFSQLVAVSHYTRNLLWKVHPKLPVQVINNGFSLPDVPTTLPLPLPGCPALITVGSVSKRKGQQNVIKALPLLRTVYSNVHYHIVGIPSEQAAFMELAQELGVAEQLTFHGTVSDQALPQLLRGASIFMMLSQQLDNGDVEGFGIAVLEANALGLPAIGTRNSGIADAIQDGHSGILTDPTDSQAVLAAVETILADHAGYSARAKAWSEGFRWEKVVEQYLQVLS